MDGPWRIGFSLLIHHCDDGWAVVKCVGRYIFVSRPHCFTQSLYFNKRVERRRYRSFRPSLSRHDVVSNARLLLDPPADKQSLGQTEFSMVGIWGITLGKFLKFNVRFREFWCTMVHDYRTIWLVELDFVWFLTSGYFKKFPVGGGSLQFPGVGGRKFPPETRLE